jgi:hypothetical protein
MNPGAPLPRDGGELDQLLEDWGGTVVARPGFRAALGREIDRAALRRRRQRRWLAAIMLAAAVLMTAAAILTSNEAPAPAAETSAPGR